MLIGFVQGYEELKWGISKLNPLCNGPRVELLWLSHLSQLKMGIFVRPTIHHLNSCIIHGAPPFPLVRVEEEGTRVGTTGAGRPCPGGAAGAEKEDPS